MPFKNNEWSPNKKQAKFLSVPNSIREAFYGGGAGSGKSEILLMYPIVNSWHENPKFKQVFMRRTYPELRNEIVPRSREIYSKFGAEFNKSTMTWTFPRPDQYGGRGLAAEGAIVLLGHCENEEDVHNYDSMEINLYTPDEVTSLTEFQYLYIAFTRVRTSDPDLPAIVRGAGMPGGIGHSWVKKRFVDPAVLGGKIIVGRGNNKRIFIHATLADNPNIDPTYSQSLDGLPEAERQAKKFGSWDAYLGQVFEEFRDKHYPDEPDNALHVVEPFVIPDWWPKIVSIDWGFAPPAMTYVAYGAISPDRRVYIYREQAWQKTKIEEWAGYVKEFVDKEHPRVIKMCKSAGQDRGQEHTILQQVTDALGCTVDLTSNSAGSRVAGKMLLHEYFRWKPRYVPSREPREYSDEKAAWILRNHGMIGYKDYLKSFNPVEQETNLPKMLIFKDCCPLLVNAIKSASYDKTNTQDVAEFAGDDPYDAIRYLVDTADRYFSDAASDFNKVTAMDSLVRNLAETNDWNSYYRNARKVEALGVVNPIQRYHHNA